MCVVLNCFNRIVPDLFESCQHQNALFVELIQYSLETKPPFGGQGRELRLCYRFPMGACSSWIAAVSSFATMYRMTTGDYPTCRAYRGYVYAGQLVIAKVRRNACNWAGRSWACLNCRTCNPSYVMRCSPPDAVRMRNRAYRRIIRR